MAILEILIEMNLRGIHLRPVDMYRSAVTDFLLEEDGSILPPLTSLPGVGQQAAEAFAAAREGAPLYLAGRHAAQKGPQVRCRIAARRRLPARPPGDQPGLAV